MCFSLAIDLEQSASPPPPGDRRVQGLGPPPGDRAMDDINPALPIKQRNIP